MNTHDTQPHDARAPRWKPSVTVAAVIEREGRYLLVEEHTRAGLRLNTSAGHLEPGETPQQGAVGLGFGLGQGMAATDSVGAVAEDNEIGRAHV